MDSFDEKLKERAKAEQPPLPEGYEERLRLLCDSLQEKPEKPKRSGSVRWLTWVAAAAAAVFVIVPNVSAPVAYAMEEIPVLGSIVRVVTLRNYFYQDEHHQASVQTPELQQAGNAGQQVNQQVQEYTDALIQKFQQECETQGYKGLDVSYQVLTDTPEWFTLRIDTVESEGGSWQFSRIYNIDKKKDQVVSLSDLFGETDNYVQRLSAEVQGQANRQMKADSEKAYFLDENFAIEPDQNFYWNENGLLVLVFDEYEIAPGSKGSPEFVIPAEVTDALKNS